MSKTGTGEQDIVGFGCLGITHPHTSGRVKALQRRTDVKIFGAADDSALLSPFAAEFGLERRTREAILSDDRIHAVLVHSKSEKMADLTIEALEAGKAVLVEKPAGRSAADARRIVDAVQRTNGLVQVGYCWHFSPSVEAMQSAIEKGRLGKILQVRAHAGCSHNEAATSHLNDPEDIGGAVFVIGCHMIERILNHFGLPKSVNARITKFPGFRGTESREDAAGAILNYDDKVISIDFMSWDVLPWAESWDLTAYGTEGIMSSRVLPASYKVYDSGRAGMPEGWTEWRETSFPEGWAARKTEYSPELAEIDNTVYFDREAASFLNSFRNGTPSAIPATQALNINLVIEALYASSESAGAEVHLKV
ncbi:oxidoreductase [Caballeronia mineralivorans PML1(12)]|uniref:Oxidoreductase n=1 Tax=Caballeronia mineralivorans PML1(12) TaxID=908627 RepID=A0A0J1CN52_9BURK|nr:Gfo/Idh/MocA family oxidoreductase [Caballeronia mineralivorans]KLU21826.1 oxidoreductase [Caballeronia mineralivorans PML1(12)]